MSTIGAGPNEPDPRAAPPEIDAAAASWVVRCREGMNEASRREFAAWRTSDPRNEHTFQRLAAMSEALDRASQTGATQAISVELKMRAGRRRFRRRLLATGAGLAAILAVAASGWFRRGRDAGASDQRPAMATTDSMRRLPDGSTAELNRGAEIAVKFEAGFRRVELVRGEALFSVEKNPSRPFIVRAGGVEVRAVGTAFNVRFADTGVEVLVTEGKVTLSDATKGQSLLPSTSTRQPGVLVAGQRAVVSAAQPEAVEISEIAPSEVEARLSWRSARLQYVGVELAQAVEQINRKNRVQISFENEKIGELRISGMLLSDDAETFSRLVAEMFGLEAEHRGSDEICLIKRGAAPGR